MSGLRQSSWTKEKCLEVTVSLGMAQSPEKGVVNPARAKRKERKSLSRVQLFATPQTVETRLPCPWNSSGKDTGVGSHSLLHRLEGGRAYHILRSWGRHPKPCCRLVPCTVLRAPWLHPGLTWTVSVPFSLVSGVLPPPNRLEMVLPSSRKRKTQT